MKTLTKLIKKQTCNAKFNLIRSLAAVVLATMLTSGLQAHTRAHMDDLVSQAVGSLDASFGNSGKVITDLFGNEDDPTAMAIQQDGKIIVVGGSIKDGIYGVSLARYNQDGSIDAS